MSHLKIEALIKKRPGIYISDVQSLNTMCSSGARTKVAFTSRQDTKYYHYTVEDRLKTILDTKVIKPSPHRKKDLMYGEKQFTWLTTNPCWDNTALYGNSNDLLDKAGRIRITVKGSYPKPKKTNGIPHWDNLVKLAKKVGVNPNDWAVSKKLIHAANIETIEIWENSEWVDYSKWKQNKKEIHNVYPLFGESSIDKKEISHVNIT